LEESLKLRRQIGDKRGIAMALGNLAEMLLEGGEREQLVDLLEESRSLGDELQDRDMVALSLGNLGEIALREGDYWRAAELLKQSLTIDRDLGIRWAISVDLSGLAEVAHARADTLRAARLFGAVHGLCEDPSVFFPRGTLERHETIKASALAQLGEAAWEAARQEGRAMTLEEAVSYALEENAGPPRPYQPGQLGKP
jgi:tetratricopeptide (TPR) repeat protein